MNDLWKFEHDQRQYKLMLDQLSMFTEGNMDIGPLIGRLKALVFALEIAAPSWKDEFMDEWGTLEIIYAMARDRLESHPTDEVSGLITDAVALAQVAEAVKNLQHHVSKCLTSIPPT